MKYSTCDNESNRTDENDFVDFLFEIKPIEFDPIHSSISTSPNSRDILLLLRIRKKKQF